jgi:thioredoxin 1
MNKTMKIIVVVGLLIAIGIVIAVKHTNTAPSVEQTAAAPAAPVSDSENVAEEAMQSPEPEALPKLLDLGAGKCIPCKMMAPILDELKETYADTFEVVFIDVWENPDEAKQYDIRMIPTQIFYDAAGKELFRHEGFYSKEDILGKWQTLGIIMETEG